MRDQTADDLPRTLQPVLGWLDARHRAAIAEHLRRLDSEERARRFGREMPDAAVATYADGVDFGTQWLIGAFSFDQRLVALAHASPVRAGRDGTLYAAFSVDRAYRRRGIGRALLCAVVDRLQRAAGACAVSIGAYFEWTDDAPRDGAAAGGGAGAYELCAGVRIEVDRRTGAERGDRPRSIGTPSVARSPSQSSRN
jgi:GNAT superfamily N-acetyltransferase